jgi:transposase-like protein
VPAISKEHSTDKREPALERTRDRLRDLSGGQLPGGDAKSELVRLAARLIVEEVLEAEVGDALGRDYYENGPVEGSGYGSVYRRGRQKTAEGMIDFGVPQVSDRAESFYSAIRRHLAGRTEALEQVAVEMLARGLGVRDIEETFTTKEGWLLLSRTAVSELGERL